MSVLLKLAYKFNPVERKMPTNSPAPHEINELILKSCRKTNIQKELGNLGQEEGEAMSDKDRDTQKLARVGNSGRRNWEEGLYTLLN